MAEMIIRAIEKRDERGSVIIPVGAVRDVMPDGHVWGLNEMAHEAIRIAQVPNTTVEELQGLLTMVDDETIGARHAFVLDLQSAYVEKAGLRAFFDEHESEDIAIKNGLPKSRVVEAIPMNTVEVRLSVRDDVRVKGGVRARAFREVVDLGTYERFDVNHLRTRFRERVSSLNVRKVGAKLRKHVVATMDLSLIDAITIPYEPKSR